VQTRVAKWGNSLAVRLPASLADEASLAGGDTVEIENRDGIILIHRTKPRLRLADVLG
jgi:antitoxin MazE